MDAWRVERTKKPRCNRPPGHAGPHRRYTPTAEIHAEWTDAIAEAKEALRRV
jgi:hypothetical protein